MRFVFIFLLLIFNIRSQSQIIDPRGIKITNFNSRYEFTHAGVYDSDLKIWTTGPYRAQAIVSINYNGGEGYLSTFITSKATFTIVSCIKFDTYYWFNLKNSIGNDVKASLVIKDGYVVSFRLYNPLEKNWVVLIDY